MPRKEAQARIRTNRLLEQAGWRFFPENGKPVNIITARLVAMWGAAQVPIVEAAAQEAEPVSV